MTGLELRGIEIAIGGRILVAIQSLAVAPGETATVMGPSGSGKSSLLAFVCGALDPAFRARGRAWVGGEEITGLPTHRRQVGILFQDDLLFPHLSVADNLAFALPPDAARGVRRREQIERVLAEAELGGFGDRDPATLSGGQRARVALLRALIAQPRALLLDEPFSKLDLELRDRFRTLVFEHARRRRLPVLLVTHDDADARAAGGQVLRLDGFVGGDRWPGR